SLSSIWSISRSSLPTLSLPLLLLLLILLCLPVYTHTHTHTHTHTPHTHTPTGHITHTASLYTHTHTHTPHTHPHIPLPLTCNKKNRKQPQHSTQTHRPKHPKHTIRHL